MGGTATDGRCDTNAGIRSSCLCPKWSAGGRPRHVEEDPQEPAVARRKSPSSQHSGVRCARDGPLP
jgi:hypothetical protein